MEMKSIFPLKPDIDTVNLSSGKTSTIESKPILTNRLKINESDKVIWLHYLFKPTKEQKAKGFKQLILTSNWFNLDSD